MIEIAGFVLAVVGIVFAFEAPRTRFLSTFGWSPSKPAEVPNTKASHALSSHDYELAKSFRSLFADSGLLRELQGHDFLLPLRKAATVPLYTVVETWTDEAHFFTHQELRSKQAIFIAAANELAEKIVLYTVPDGNGNVSVITRQMDPENLPEHVRAEARAIDAKLPAFLQSHEVLLAACNRLI
ncbi:MAG: hypothetical protein Q7U33_04170 [Methylotenera sp.]|jgi:hypothetical protein|uniref:hypothetical protein n=1 Tax=Methylotenera sp. TaxID=2051956 RepID=UPI00271AA3B8|nr:hypothetical protein [Methylotenera sp.]MDO9150555.1 hypothetical protein [Methylotenera sp.]